MRAVMPVAISYPEAVKAFLRHAGAPAEVVSVSGGPQDYWRLFVRLWNDGQPFVLVEHDIVVQQDTVATLAACPHPWCAYPYHQAPGNPVTGLGCTKITPTGVRIEVLDPAYGNPSWQNVDSVVGGILTAAYQEVHEHHPWLRHLNPRVAAEQRTGDQ